MRVGSFGEASQSAGHERPGPNSLMAFRHKPPKHTSLKKKDTIGSLWSINFLPQLFDATGMKLNTYFLHIFPHVVFNNSSCILYNKVKTFSSSMLHILLHVILSKFVVFGVEVKQ